LKVKLRSRYVSSLLLAATLSTRHFQFSVDDNQAEKGTSQDSSEKIENLEDFEGKEEFRRNAKSWAIYLEEAGEHAKEQAEVWKTGLESLLLFVSPVASSRRSMFLAIHRPVFLPA
jgi:hypothetical protein